MFNNFFSSFKIAQNLEKVKATLTSAYTVITKIINLLTALNKEFQLADKLKVYVPAILSALVTVVTVLEKIAPLLGLTLVKAQDVNVKLSKEDLLAELNESLKELNELVK